MSDSSDDDDVPLAQLARSGSYLATPAAAADASPLNSCSGVRPPASSASAEATVAPMAAVAVASTPQDLDTLSAPAASPQVEPAAAKPSRKRKAAPAASSAPKAPSAVIKAGGVSARAARTGAGGWDLSEASGDLDAEYETLGVLGRGNFAEVNVVRHRQTRELRALKFCCKLDALSYAHLRAESTLASRVSHPFVLSPLAVADSPGRAGNFSVLLPLCAGGDLLQLLRRHEGRAIAEASACAYGAMVVLGLSALHDAGLCYRDLKPENLLVKENGYLCIADFGFTAPLSECRKMKVGTAMYQAPELLKKMKHGTPVDWWALGCLLLEMVSGHSPFAADDEDATEALVLAHVLGDPPAAPEGAPAPSAPLRDLCSGLLHPNPSERLSVEGIQKHAWFASLDWNACAEMRMPPPSTPPPLDTDDTDKLLEELSRRCQQGFD